MAVSLAGYRHIAFMGYMCVIFGNFAKNFICFF